MQHEHDDDEHDDLLNILIIHQVCENNIVLLYDNDEIGQIDEILVFEHQLLIDDECDEALIQHVDLLESDVIDEVDEVDDDFIIVVLLDDVDAHYNEVIEQQVITEYDDEVIMMNILIMVVNDADVFHA